MKPVRLAAAAAAVVALAVPAIASAHPSVYTGNAKVVTSGTGVTPVTVGDQVRHMVTNHGFTYVLDETNGATTKGVLSYAKVPGAYRNQPGFEPVPGTRTRLLSEADTGAQAHATCRGVPALEAETAVLGWQGADPFYNYVPFQNTSAGLEDDPASWIDDVQALTGVNLAQVTDLAAACTGLGGGATFVPADPIVTTAASLAAGTVAEATEPLEEEIDHLEAEKAAALQAAATADAAAKAATARAIAAEAALAAEKKPLTVKLADNRQPAKQVANRGAKVELTGPPSRKVTVKLLVTSSRAKALGLKSNVLGSATVTTNGAGTASVTVDVSNKAEKPLKNLKSALKLSVSAVAGDRADNASGTLTR